MYSAMRKIEKEFNNKMHREIDREVDQKLKNINKEMKSLSNDIERDVKLLMLEAEAKSERARIEAEISLNSERCTLEQKFYIEKLLLRAKLNGSYIIESTGKRSFIDITRGEAKALIMDLQEIIKEKKSEESYSKEEIMSKEERFKLYESQEVSF